MATRARLASLVLVGALLAACGAQGAPSAGTPPPSAAAIARASADPCLFAVTGLGAFTQRMAANLTPLRPLVLATSFDSSETVATSGRVSATLTAYSGLEGTLRGCGATADLAPRLEALRSSARAMLDKGLSAPAAQVQRDAAVGLFGLLPEVLALSEAGKSVADSLAIGVQVAQVPNDAAQPIGSLAPLPTIKPPAKPTPRPTPRPTTKPTTAGGGSTGSSSSGWAVNANAYIRAVRDTYSKVTTNALVLYGVGWGPGHTPEEIAAIQTDAARFWKPAVRELNSHLAYMNSHAARTCYKDAYAADRALVKRWLVLLQARIYPYEYTPEGRAVQMNWDDAMSRTTALLNRMNSYMADCP